MNINKTKKITTLGMFCALAYIMMVVVKIPVVAFLKYEPKDVIITLSGLIYGPLYSLAVSLVVSFVEMITVSDTGIIGFFMNVVSTAAFACTASVIYRKKRSVGGAVAGLAVGVVFMTAVMLLWNFVMTPVFMNTARADVAAMLVPVFLPFNLLKGTVNACLTYMLYTPCVNALRSVGLAAPSQSSSAKKPQLRFVLPCLLIIVVCVIIILKYNGVF